MLTACINSILFLRLFFLLLPLAGFLNLIFPTPSVPFLLPVLWSGISGRCMRITKSSFKPHLPIPVLIYIGAVLFSAFLAFLSFSQHFPHFGAVVAELPWGTVILKNAMAWVLLSLITYLSGAALFSWLNTDQVKSENLFRWILIGLMGAFVVGVVQYLGQVEWAGLKMYLGRGYDQYNATFRDPNILGVFSAIIFPVAISYFFARKFNFYSLSAGIAIVFLIMISNVRSAYLLFTVAFLFMAFSVDKRMRSGLLAFFLMGVMFFLFQYRFMASTRLSIFVSRIFMSIQGGGSIFEFLGDRTHLWKSGWVTFQHNIPFGTGLGAYLIKMPTYKAELDIVTNDNCGNMYLHLASEQGVVGLLAFFLLIGSTCKEFLISDNRRSRGLKIGAFSAFIGLLVAFIFGAHLLSFEINILFWFLLAIAYEHHPRNQTRPVRTIQKHS